MECSHRHGAIGAQLQQLRHVGLQGHRTKREHECLEHPSPSISVPDLKVQRSIVTQILSAVKVMFVEGGHTHSSTNDRTTDAAVQSVPSRRRCVKFLKKPWGSKGSFATVTLSSLHIHQWWAHLTSRNQERFSCDSDADGGKPLTTSRPIGRCQT